MMVAAINRDRSRSSNSFPFYGASAVILPSGTHYPHMAVQIQVAALYVTVLHHVCVMTGIAMIPKDNTCGRLGKSLYSYISL